MEYRRRRFTFSLLGLLLFLQLRECEPSVVRIKSEFYLSRTPSLVTIHPVVLFSILDHYLRRTDSQDRVIGTLLGTRSESDVIEVKSSFAVLHSETSEQVAVDMDYHKAMYELHHKVNPREVIVGWCVLVDSNKGV